MIKTKSKQWLVLNALDLFHIVLKKQLFQWFPVRPYGQYDNQSILHNYVSFIEGTLMSLLEVLPCCLLRRIRSQRQTLYSKGRKSISFRRKITTNLLFVMLTTFYKSTTVLPIICPSHFLLRHIDYCMYDVRLLWYCKDIVWSS